ncbi:nitrate- and nitrite sensing domain-containing protein [Streptomyces sp. 6N223]|uniref:nitrate- and nitrite sensing domain-containing protein n=1 Tax=Streptomyces sp. 6N223 TaxID=3457412 RepID=UPI003FD30FBE
MRRSKATPSTPGGPGDTRTATRGNFTPATAVSGAARTEDPVAPRPAADPGPSGGRLAPRNWRVATKLYAILLIPVLLALAFGGLRVADAYRTSQEADDAERIAELVRASTAYAHALIDERDVTARPLLEGDREDPVIAEARGATDAAADEFWAAVERAPRTDGIRRRIDDVRQAEPELEPLRAAAYTDALGEAQTEEGYVVLQHPLMTFANELRLGSGNVTSYGRTVYAVSLSKSASSLQRAIGTHLLIAPGPGEDEARAQLTAFGSYAYLENVALAEFYTAGTPEDRTGLQEAMDEAEARMAAESDAPVLARMVERISSGAAPGDLAGERITPDSWFAAATAEFTAYRDVEQALVDHAVAEARDIAATARRDVIVNSAIVVASLLLAFVLAGLMARSMSRNMRRLRGAAFEVAGQRLPAVVDQLSRTNPGEVDTRVASIPINSRDEIGEVARAFEQVHREAVRLAAEQALLRGNVNAIFANLSGRNQGLIERQLALIGALETNEADPEQLENLFKLDHLATRMRRNGENLLVLAGEEPGHRWNQPVPLVDVMRAAGSEVEAYERIELSGVPECEIHGAVVNDLVHLLAELLENATVFSSPHTRVRVTATRLPDGRVMIEIHDKGIGLTQDDFAEINGRLASPPAVDADISRRMGLYVVGRLAERHGIRVQLRPSGEQTGTTALVMLPEPITHGGGGQKQPPEEEFTVSRIVPEGPYTSDIPDTESQRLRRPRTAAELGFDDSRYASPAPNGSPGATPRTPPAPGPAVAPAPGFGDTVELDSLGRPPRRDERHSPPSAATSSPVPAPEPPVHDQPYDQPPPRRPDFGTFPPSVPLNDVPHTESFQAGPTDGAQRVGFTGPDPVAAEYRSTTSAGLPRRDGQWQPEEDPAQRLREEPVAEERPPGEVRWDRGPRREERVGGTTASGLPRRVPRANLTEHPSPEPAQGGAQISRDPADVRGRLSSLHRGVQQGRGAGGHRGTQNDEPGSGPGHT